MGGGQKSGTTWSTVWYLSRYLPAGRSLPPSLSYCVLIFVEVEASHRPRLPYHCCRYGIFAADIRYPWLLPVSREPSFSNRPCRYPLATLAGSHNCFLFRRHSPPWEPRRVATSTARATASALGSDWVQCPPAVFATLTLLDLPAPCQFLASPIPAPLNTATASPPLSQLWASSAAGPTSLAPSISETRIDVRHTLHHPHV